MSFTPIARGECEIFVRRDDGVLLRAVQPLRGTRQPHDLVHFAVEGALELQGGFWDCVAKGAEFKSFERVGGRRAPHASERSREILSKARRQLTTAEVLAGAVERLAGRGWDNDRERLLREVDRRLSNCEPPRPPISGERITHAIALLRDHERSWSQLAVGQGLVLDWPLRRAGASIRRHASSAR